MRAFALAVLALLAAGAARAAPYPQSTLITGLAWDAATHRSGGVGGDRWPVTSGGDGRVYTTWGDGTVGCPAKVSYGVAAVAGGPGAGLATLGCGRPGIEGGKFHGILMVDGTLYGVVRMQRYTTPSDGFAVWRSTDKGKTWKAPNPSWVFPRKSGPVRPEAFVNFGPDYTGAPDGYVYLPAVRSRPSATAGPDSYRQQVYLMRVPKTRLQVRSAYEYFAGTAAAPSWSRLPDAARPVFVDGNGAYNPKMVYNAGLRRYLLTAAHGDYLVDSGAKIGVFEAEQPWGPWFTVDYQENWLGISGGHSLGTDFPSLWMADGGRTLWAVFSCYNRHGGLCGKYHDRYNLIRARLTVR